MLGEFLGLLTAVAVLFYFWLRKTYRYWKVHGVPGPEPSFPFGNLTDLFFMRMNTTLLYDRMYKAFKDEPAVGFYRLWKPQLLIRDITLAKEILIRDFSHFDSTGIEIPPDLDPILGHNPFVTSGPRWKEIRSLHSQTLTPVKLKLLIPLIGEVCKDMKAHVDQHIEEPIEVQYFAGQFTTDVVGSCIFGIQTNSFKNPDAEFRRKAYEMFQPSAILNLSYLLAISEPRILKVTGQRVIPKDMADYFVSVVQDVCEYRKKNEIQRNDFLQHLLSDQLKKNEKPDYLEMAAHCATFFIDGYETSALTITYAIYALAVNQEEQKKLRESINEANVNMDNVDYDNLHSLKYLDWIISESMRMHPAAATLSRMCTKETTLSCQGKDYHMEKGVLVAVPICSINRDPEIFPDPDKFLPERFEDNPNPAGFFPFGGGPRMCLGYKFATAQMRMFIVSLILDYEITLAQDPSVPIKYDPLNPLLNIPKGGVKVKFNKLKK